MFTTQKRSARIGSLFALAFSLTAGMAHAQRRPASPIGPDPRLVADSSVEAPEPPDPLMPRPFLFDIGTKVQRVGNRGFGQFSEDKSLATGSFGLTFRMLTLGRWGISLGARFDVGADHATLRSSTLANTDLVARNVLLAAEARLHVASYFYAFGRLSPGVSIPAVSLTDGATNTSFSSTKMMPMVEASVGAAFRMGGVTPGFWLLTDLGYTLQPTFDATLQPDTGDDGRSYGPIRLAPVNLSAPFFRLSLALTI